MLPAAARLAPALVLAAFVLQGCDGPPFKRYVEIYVGQACQAKAQELYKGGENIQIQGAAKCEDMDVDAMENLGVTDCEGTNDEIQIVGMAAECQVAVYLSDAVLEACAVPVADKLRCKAAVDEEVVTFQAYEPPVPAAQAACGWEVSVALTEKCSESAEHLLESYDFVGEVDEACVTGVDLEWQAALGLTEEQCRAAATSAAADFTVVACVMSALYREDGCKSSEDVTEQWIDNSVASFAKSAGELGLEQADHESFDSLLPPGYGARLYALRTGQLVGPVRFSALPRAVAAGAASALAAALLCIAWRRHASSSSQLPEVMQNILVVEEIQPVA